MIKRCPNGSHKNKKTKKCELFMKSTSTKNKNKSKSTSKSISKSISTKKIEIKIAIIVPFRDLTETKERTKQLHVFLKYMTTFMNETKKKWKIFIIEQMDDGRKFNRGKLLNIGFNEAYKEKYNFFIFHDVDLLPSKEMMEYYMMPPKNGETYHIASVWNRYGNNPSYFGGITAFSAVDFKKINGYPNNFWGWGGEDDELYKRVIKNKMIIKKADKGQIKDLENMNFNEKKALLDKRGDKFLYKWEALNLHNKTWKINGLHSLKYKIIKKYVKENNQRYEWIKVDVLFNNDENDKYAFINKIV